MEDHLGYKQVLFISLTTLVAV